MINSLICCVIALMGCRALNAATPIGIFENHGDVGPVLHPGSAQYDAAKRTYTISGSGVNMWSTADEFHYVWKKVSGNVTLTADIAFSNESGDPHKKAMLVMRQSLDPASAYADIAFHGNGLTSLQWREETGAATHEIQSNISAPKRVRIEKQGESFYLSVSATAAEPQFAGTAMYVPLTDPFYVGIGVCAHNKDAVESAVFSNVDLISTPPPTANTSHTAYRTLETIAVASTDRRVVYTTTHYISSPSWTHDGTSLLFNSGYSELSQVPAAGGEPTVVETSLRAAVNNKEVAPDTGDGLTNVLPHLSPDGTRVAFLTMSRRGDTQVNRVAGLGEVTLRVMLLSDKSVRTLAKFNAWPDSFDTSPWSPDSRKLAFVSHQFK